MKTTKGVTQDLKIAENTFLSLTSVVIETQVGRCCLVNIHSLRMINISSFFAEEI